MLLAACHPARAPAVWDGGAGLPASCGAAPALQTAFEADLAQGRAPEASTSGTCVADAARKGSVAAAMLLADVYRRAMVAAAASGNSAALGLDLFGRQVGWLRLAAERGDPAAQVQLALAMDGPRYRPMSDMALAWYQAAAENGSRPALATIASAYARGRILDERLYDFRKWLESQPHPAPAYRDAAQLLARPPAMGLPN